MIIPHIKPATEDSRVFNKALGTVIHNLREKAGVSLYDLADSIDFNHNQMKRCEDGIAPPTVRVLHHIARILGATSSDIAEQADALVAKTMKELAK